MSVQIVKERNPYYDSLKFVLISLVVLAHVFEPTKNNSVVNINLTLYNWINLFHMPVFIFLSGRFSGISDRQRYKKGIIKLLETYIIFQSIWLVYLRVTSDNLTLSDYLTPWYIMWYILSLAFWRLIVYLFLDKIKENPIIWISASSLLGILVGFVPIGVLFSFQRTFAFLPFFVIGFCTRDYDVMKSIRRMPVVLAIIVIIVSFFLLYPIEERMPIAYVFTCAFPYTEFSTKAYVFLLRAIFYIAAPCVSIAVVRLIPSVKRFANWGRQTMFIYIYHAFATRAFYHLFPNGTLPFTLPWLFAYALVIIVVLLFFSRSKVLNWLLNPISNTIKK